MCGRYTLTADGKTAARFFRIEEKPLWRPRYNIAPGQPVPAVRANPHLGGREATAFNWGLIPFWTKDPGSARQMINAQAETAAEKPSFRAPMRHHRCLLPATGFYEWRRKSHGRRQPCYFTREDGGLFAFAAIFDHWAHPDGSEIESCAILTQPANALVSPIHTRMPVIIDRRNFDAWLDPDQQRPKALEHLLQPWEPAGWTVYPVGEEVNKTTAEGPGLIAEAGEAEEQTDFLNKL